jgi:hypothetical protein
VQIVAIPSNQVACTKLLFEKLAKIEGQKCTKCDCPDPIATVPEWYEYRPESHRRQGVLVFKELKSDNTIGNDPYSITIPHCTLATAPTASPVDTYQKGNWQGILTLKDNSKVIVNCLTVAEANRVLTLISTVIDPAYLQNSFRKVGEHRGLAYKQITVKATLLDYYPTGTKNMKPAYRKSFI